MTTLKLIFASLFILAGILVLISGVIGIFRIKYVLNRLHAAAMGDSLGLFLITIGMIIINGISFSSLKLLAIVALFWIASPVCSHLLSAIEVTTNPELEKDCEMMEIDEYEVFKS
ncbi:MAG: monovalent cation/H(+) antiporter subunit G [Butyrivibrio sp.]|nr:monovalent cation/H(+) antiporter subunit G [Butyrivibrio sp.]